jgi:hypothetical protein
MTDTYKERATMAETIIGTTDLSDEQIARWRALQGRGMVSAVGEYTPDAFWELLDAYEDLRAATGWRPIESAPKDGTPVLLKPRSGGDLLHPFVGRLHTGAYGWSFAAPVGYGGIQDDALEGWMPLPPSPESKP